MDAASLGAILNGLLLNAIVAAAAIAQGNRAALAFALLSCGTAFITFVAQTPMFADLPKSERKMKAVCGLSWLAAIVGSVLVII